MFPLLRFRLSGLLAPSTREVSADRAVRTVILVLAVAAVGYTARFGSRLPLNDEWDLMAMTLDGRSAWGFATAPHNEHRYVLSRAVWLGLLRATAYDLRVPRVATVLVLAWAGLAGAVLAAKVRGRASPADAVFPALLLHWGHRYNLLMAYQIGVALVAAFVIGLLWQVARAVEPGRERRVGWWAGAWLAALALQGGFGLAFVPPVGLWLLYLAARGRDRWPGERVAALVLPVATAGYTVWHLLTLPAAPVGAARTVGSVARAVGEYLLAGFGTWTAGLGEVIPVAGGLVGLGYVVVGWWTARAAWRDPAERPRALGLLAILSGQLIQTVGVAQARGGGLADRFVTTSAVGLVVCGLGAVLYGPRLRSTGQVAGAVLAAGLFVANIGPAERVGKVWQAQFSQLEQDIRAGWPPTFIAGKYAQSPIVLIGEERLAYELNLFRQKGIGPFARLEPDPPLTIVPVPIPFPVALPECGAVPFTAGGPPPPGLTFPNKMQHVVGLRVEVEQQHVAAWQEVALRWTGGPDGRTPRVERAYVATGPQTHTVTFFLAGEVPTDARLEPACPTFGLIVHRAEWLVTPDEP